MIDPHRLKIGRALVTGGLGGAKAAPALVDVIEATREGFQLGKDSANWPDYLLAALAEVDSALEASDSAIAQARASNADLRGALKRADSDIADLQANCTREGERANEAEGRAAIAEGMAATLRGLLDVARGDMPLSLAAMPGERVDPGGKPIRSNTAWRELAALAVKERDKWHAEARESTQEAHAMKARCDIAVNSLSDALASVDALQVELTEAREALAQWKAKAERAELHASRFQAVAIAVGQCPIADLPDRVRAAFSVCTVRGAAINAMESGK